MSILIDKAGFAAQIHHAILSRAAVAGEVDGMRLLSVLGGVLAETLLLFDDPDEGYLASVALLSRDLACEPHEGPIPAGILPPSYLLDQNTEQGRAVARQLFEDWLQCAFEFHEIVMFVIQHVLIRMEEDGQPREETLRLVMECTVKCLAYEIAAQELCDIVIEEKIGREGWSLGESVSGLSAVAGRCLGLSRNASQLFTKARVSPDNLDQVAYVMTQEATRLGIPAGTDWRFGLAANDCPVTAPFDLIFSLWPCCRNFLHVLGMTDMVDQAVACAKAAGRMLAVAAGGERPELEPVVAKPLAMAAMTDTYKTVCRTMDEAAAV